MERKLGETVKRNAFKHYTFPNGCIRQIEFSNFLTFDHAVLEFGPNLNLIIGPNGAGKSSVMCGLCLAVGGKPKLLGRSEFFKDYIKTGCNSAYVECLIVDDSKRTGIIEVRLTIEKNRHSFTIDGKKASANEVNDLTERLNIQVNNPCVFLAQDKVKSFASQNPQLLLENTLKAADLNLMEQYDELQEYQDQRSLKVRSFIENDNQKKKYANEIEELEPRVTNYLETVGFNDKILLVKQKRAILIYQNAKSNYNVALSNVAEIGTYEKDVSRRMAQTEKHFQTSQKYLENARKNMRKLISSVESSKAKIEVDPQYFDNAVRIVRRELASERANLEKWQKTKDNIIVQLEVAQDEHEKAAEHLEEQTVDFTNNWKPKESQLNADMQRYASEVQTLQRKTCDIDLKLADVEKIASYNVNVMNNRLRTAQFSDRVINAYNYYQAHRNEFEKPVYVPLIDVVCKERETDLLQLSNILFPNDACTFVFCSKTDEMRFRSFGMNTTVVDATMVSKHINHIGTAARGLDAYGIVGTAQSLVECPNEIRVFFEFGCGWSNCLIGDLRAERNYDGAISEATKRNLRSARIFMPNFFVYYSTSKYSGEHLISKRDYSRNRIKFMQPLQVRFRSVDRYAQERMQREKEALERSHEDLLAEQKNTMHLLTEIRGKQRDLDNYRNKVRLLESKIMEHQTTLATHEQQKPKICDAEKVADEAETRACYQALECINHSVAAWKVFATASISLTHENKLVIRNESACLQFRKATQTLEKELRQVQKKLHGLMTAMKIENTAYEIAKAELQEYTSLGDIDTKNRQFKELQNAFEKSDLPDTIEALDDKIQEFERRCNIMQIGTVGTNADVRRQSELKKKLASIAKMIDAEKTALADLDKKMSTVLDDWTTKLEDLIAKISANFAKFLGFLNALGEVTLLKPEHKFDIKKYGINIAVSFRSTTNIQRLDDKVQSGGERSVSTMLYLLALQELSPVPFRCVDEINQGMDPMNERKVFSLVVRNLADSGNIGMTQYFLLTPKLLRNLEYSEKVVVQFVLNSPVIPQNMLAFSHADSISKLKKKDDEMPCA